MIGYGEYPGGSPQKIQPTPTQTQLPEGCMDLVAYVKQINQQQSQERHQKQMLVDQRNETEKSQPAQIRHFTAGSSQVPQNVSTGSNPNRALSQSSFRFNF